MKYYWLTNSLKIKEIGRYPQSILPVSLGNIDDFGDGNPIDLENPIDDRTIELPEPVLHSRAKASTFLGIDTINFTVFLVIKNYFLLFLKEYNIPEYQVWNINVHQSKEIIKEYCLFRLSFSDDEKYIDYVNSEFLIGKLGDWEDPSIREPVKVNNFQNYKSLIDTLQASEDDSQIRCDKLVLNLSKIKVDMFRLIKNPICMGYFVSETLKKAIEEKHYTGMEFKEIEELDDRIEITY